jgi:hypothetical protein
MKITVIRVPKPLGKLILALLGILGKKSEGQD